MLKDEILADDAAAKLIDKRRRKNVCFAQDEMVIIALVVTRIGVGIAVVPSAVHARVARDRVASEQFVAFAEIVIYAHAGLCLVNRETDQRQIIIRIGERIVRRHIGQWQILQQSDYKTCALIKRLTSSL